ncbi:hypothetical protein V9L17_07640 [Pseudarthrobacter sp. CCNWLW207]
MVHATPDPRSYGSEDTTKIHAPAQASQTAKRAAYIEALLKDWPAPTPQQRRTIGSLLGNATPVVSVADYQSWEIKRHVEATETPGTHGTYGNEVAA